MFLLISQFKPVTVHIVILKLSDTLQDDLCLPFFLNVWVENEGRCLLFSIMFRPSMSQFKLTTRITSCNYLLFSL